MKKIDWKNIVAAVFFVAALIISGVGQAFENTAQDPRANMLCDCARSGFSQPHCRVLENTPFPGATTKQQTDSHGVMPRIQTPALPQRDQASE